MSNPGWYPPQWSRGPAMVSLKVKTPGFTSSYQLDYLGNPGSLSSTGPTAPLSYTAQAVDTLYVFDAVLELEHDQRVIKTQHPVQTGANISSHAFMLPARLMMYVGMSDVMAAAVQWPGNNKSKSVAAYQTMLALQRARNVMTVTTRLKTYRNMLIVGVTPRETVRTIAGLRARIEFEEVLTASVSNGSASARPNDTNSTGLGLQNTAPVPTSVDKQYSVPATSTPLKGEGLGGAYSSVSGPQIVTAADVGASKIGGA